MKRRPKVAILNTVAAANVIDDTTAKYWYVAKTTSGTDNIIGPIDYGKTSKVQSINPVAEVRQLVIVGASTTKETVVADTTYKVSIGREDKYESTQLNPYNYKYAAPTVLTGDADGDRTNLYTALVSKINAHAYNNVTAYPITEVDFTAGTDGAGTATNLTVGETVTQETSTNTARVAKSTITSGTMAGNDAAGTVFLFDVERTGWLETAKTLTGGTSLCVITGTNATTIHDTGIAILDDAGYYLSPINREGRSFVGTTNFSVSTAELAIQGVCAIGIGSDMAAKAATFSRDARDVTNDGVLDFVSEDGTLFDASKTYREYIITKYDGDEEALSGEHQRSYYEYHVYVDYASGNLAAFDAALAAAAAK